MPRFFRPFDRTGRPHPFLGLRRIPLRLLAPNLITLFTVCLGLTAIRLAADGRYEVAVGLVVVAAALDGVDGRLARWLKGTSKFGAELDSLADFVNFGVAPALILYFWGLHDLKNMGWIAAMLFAIAAALRLARFNVMLEDPNRPAWQGDFFVGMPAPAGAIAVLLPMYLAFLGLPEGLLLKGFATLFAVAIAALMVSQVPTFSGKKATAKVPREWVLPIFVMAVCVAALLVAFTWEVLAAVTIAYLAALPYGVTLYRRFDAQYGTSAGGAPAEAAPSETPSPPAAAEPDRPARLN